MTPEQIAEVRPRLAAFTAEVLGGLARKDQRAAGELYVRGLLADGRRKSMVPMAERLGVDHQRLQQFITSSTWDYAAVRRNVAWWFAGSQPVEALVVDDTGFAKDGSSVFILSFAVAHGCDLGFRVADNDLDVAVAALGRRRLHTSTPARAGGQTS